MMADSHCLTGRGQALALTQHRPRPGQASLRASGCLGLLLVMALITIC
jgi:hypothetical protein